MLRHVVLLFFVCSCAAATTAAWEPRRGPVYKPGQSIAEARLCSCDDCIERRCCSGDAETEYASEHELGMTLSSCSRCVRRVWTVRAMTSCAETAAVECCPGTVSE